jgi:uncharacterized protein YpmS
MFILRDAGPDRARADRILSRTRYNRGAMTEVTLERNWWRIGFFVTLFLLSGLLFLIAMLFVIAWSMPGAGPEATQQPLSWLPLVGALAAAATALASLVGVIFGWRREKRDSVKGDLEVRRMEIELEKATLELEALRGKSK